MGNVFDQIANVTIGIQSAVTNSASFGKILIVGALPATAPATAPPLVGYYESIEEVTDAGWVIAGETPDPVGIAAMVAFSQDPKPAGIYIAPIQVTGSGNNAVAEPAVMAVQRAVDEDWYVCCPVIISTEVRP